MDMERHSDSKPVKGYTAGALADGSNTGLSIDTFNYRSLILALDLTITAGSVDEIIFQESSDNGVSDAWENIPAGENLFYPDAFPLDASVLINVGCVAKERYVRVILIADTPTGSVVAGYGQLQDSMYKPQNKEASVVANVDVRSPGTLADAETTAPKRPIIV